MEYNPYLHTFFGFLTLQFLYACMRGGIEYGIEHAPAGKNYLCTVRPKTRIGQVLSKYELQIGKRYQRHHGSVISGCFTLTSKPYLYLTSSIGPYWVVDVVNNYGDISRAQSLSDMGVEPYKNGWNPTNSLHRIPV